MPARDIFLERSLPSSVDAERAVLGSVLLANRLCDEAAQTLRPEDFYLEAHRRIFAVMIAMSGAGELMDILTVAEALRSRGELEQCGGGTYIAGLIDYIPQLDSIDSYAAIVRNKADLRRLIAASNRTMAACFEGEQTAAEIAAGAGGTLDEIAVAAQPTRPRRIDDIAHEVFDRLEQQKATGGVSGLRTGFSDIDAMLGGLQGGDLVVLAARPSMGKSAMAAQFALASARSGAPALFFGLEMIALQNVQRLVASEASIDLSRIRHAYINRDEWSRLGGVGAALEGVPLYFDERTDLSPSDIRATARRMKRDVGLGLIVVDYLQLLTSRGMYRAGDRVNEVGYFSRSLKITAKELGVPVVAVSQLSRSCEARADKRPILSDLRESGNVEQDADVIAFLYRDEYYAPTDENRGVAEFIVRKQRNGPTGTIRLAFLSEFARFEDLWSRGY